LGYFGATFNRLLGGDFRAHLATPLAQLLQRWPGPVAVAGTLQPGWTDYGNPGSGRPTPIPVNMLYIDFIHSAPAIGICGRYRERVSNSYFGRLLV